MVVYGAAAETGSGGASQQLAQFDLDRRDINPSWHVHVSHDNHACHDY
jgi:hypothetical protein